MYILEEKMSKPRAEKYVYSHKINIQVHCIIIQFYKICKTVFKIINACANSMTLSSFIKQNILLPTCLYIWCTYIYEKKMT